MKAIREAAAARKAQVTAGKEAQGVATENSWLRGCDLYYPDRR
jgi:hypothetical protein